MKVEIVMPKMGESISEGTLIKWHKKKGDSVKKDEIIFEISTDKVDTEIPSPDSGILTEIRVNEQETVEVGTIVAIIETDASKINVDELNTVDKKSEIESTKTNIEIATKNEEKEVPSTMQVGGEIIDIPMPKMGESIMEGTIIKWHKNIGDVVKRDEIIFEISTDKVDTEVPSPAEGVLTEILYPVNSVVPVGVTVAKITSSTGIVKTTPVKKSELSQEPVMRNEAIEKKETLKTNRTDETDSNVFYSPLVLNIASKEGISLDELKLIKGTGINNRVTKNDILKYIENRKIEPEAKKEVVLEKETKTTQQSAVYDFSKLETEIIPMNNIRKKIMSHMVYSRDTSVHVSAVIEVDMLKIHNYIQQNKDTLLQKEGIKLTYMPFIAYATVKALREFPLVNSSINNDEIIVKKNINLGIAVAVEPNGLIVPNIKNADEKNIKGLAKSIIELSNKARNKGLIPDDITGGTFTITNYGIFGSLFGTPIINQPEVAILGVGAVTKKPVVVDINGMETIAIKPMMYLSLSHDHRLIDGMLGGRFLKYIKDTLENFDTNNV
jgi:2-oxoglutarate dehydrogenase E2 component (dihydrolipoamide succinyltransferase)